MFKYLVLYEFEIKVFLFIFSEKHLTHQSIHSNISFGVRLL